MIKLPEKLIYNNAANIVSILGVLPLSILFLEGGYQYLIPLIIYNNIMDDLDGILAVKMNIKSTFGATLDNLCDGVSHSIIILTVGMHFGGTCAVASLIAVTSLMLRVVSRLNPSSTVSGTGSPTNELIRHIFFVLMLASLFDLNAALLLIIVFTLNALSMLVPYQMPYLIRSITKSATAIGLVNVSLVIAWLIPSSAPLIAAAFLLSFLYSLIYGGIKWST